MKWHCMFALVLSLTCLLAVPRAFGDEKKKEKVAPVKQAAPAPKAQAAPSAPPARRGPQSGAQTTQAPPKATPARTGPHPGTPTTQAAPNAPSANPGSQSPAPATKTGPHFGGAKPASVQTGAGQSGTATAGASKRVAGTLATRQPRERPEYAPPDAQVVLSPEVIESDTSVPAPPEVIESVTPVPAQDPDSPLTTAFIEAATAPPAPVNFIEPVIPVLPPPKVNETVTQNEKSTGISQVEEPVVKSPIDHRVPQKKFVGPSHLSVVEPSTVRKVDGQYAIWNHGSAQGVQVGDEVKLVRGAEQIGRGQVIAVRANDCDVEIAETYAVASVAVGDGVKLLRRSFTP